MKKCPRCDGFVKDEQMICDNCRYSSSDEKDNSVISDVEEERSIITEEKSIINIIDNSNRIVV